MGHQRGPTNTDGKIDMFEVEQKYQVESADALIESLRSLGGTEGVTESHADTYFNHPSRDFAQSHEALRIRRLNDKPLITYKGPKLPGAIKARREMEWRLDPGDADGSQTETLLMALGFRLVETVRKIRRPFHLPGPWSDLEVVVDVVETLGTYAEIEAVVPDASQVDRAKNRIAELARHLVLDQAESRSYLSMVLGMNPPPGTPLEPSILPKSDF